MSLNYELTGIKDWEATCKINVQPDGKWTLNPVTEAIIFYAMFTDCTLKDPEDAQEFYCRALMHFKLMGEIAYRADGKPMELTAEEVAAHIGLRVNVGKKARTAWLKHWTGEYFKRAQEDYRKAIIARNMREIEAERPTTLDAAKMFTVDGPEPPENLD